MRGRETPDQQVGDSNLENWNSIILLVEFLLRSIGILKEIQDVLLVAIVNKIIGDRGANMRTCYS